MDYSIRLAGMRDGIHHYEWLLAGEALTRDGNELIDGSVNIKATVEKRNTVLQLNLDLKGQVSVQCDRCLDSLTMDVNSTQRLLVLIGPEAYGDDEDADVMVLDAQEQEIDLSDALYDYVVLSLPMRRVHPEGQCSKAMENLLKEYIVGSI